MNAADRAPKNRRFTTAWAIAEAKFRFLPIYHTGGRVMPEQRSERPVLQLIDHIIHQVFQGLVHELV